ncbi:sulfatase family protein [Pararhodonellum marinum]|uniref:sulfatase family protein n=1 Tax=Pararhodonellum marinum TaxID=2755358 RepID=UPI00188F7879|nr:sulfatase [Pararhodonellum marinum]
MIKSEIYRKIIGTVLPFGLIILMIACGDKSEKLVDSAVRKTPNVVLIFTDDQGYNDVGVFGSPNISTPNLDKMADEGMIYTNFYVAQAVCSASRAALMTGTYPNRLGIHGALDHRATHGLNPEETTLAEMLKGSGYATAIFGKWHLGHHKPFLPTHQGFDEFFGIPYSNDMWPNHPENKNYYPPLPLYEGYQVVDTLHQDQSMLTTWLTERAVDFINRKKDDPFFLYLAHPMPHVPLFVSDKFKGKSDRGLYGDVIMEIDWSVGEILAALEKNGLTENTLVIFLSDNGPWLSYSGHSGSADPLKEGKGTSWEGGVRVPAIMKWPGQLPAGGLQSRVAMSIDLLPTLADLCGADLPGLPIDGKNIWPILQGKSDAVSPQEAYYIYYNRNELQAVVMDRWKLVFPHRYRSIKPGQVYREDGMPIEYHMLDFQDMALYDLQEDIAESVSVLEDHPEIVKKMHELAEIARQDMGDALTEREGANLREPGRVESGTD